MKTKLKQSGIKSVPFVYQPNASPCKLKPFYGHAGTPYYIRSNRFTGMLERLAIPGQTGLRICWNALPYHAGQTGLRVCWNALPYQVNRFMGMLECLTMPGQTGLWVCWNTLQYQVKTVQVKPVHGYSETPYHTRSNRLKGMPESLTIPGQTGLRVCWSAL